jgi:hypothetical protein
MQHILIQTSSAISSQTMKLGVFCTVPKVNNRRTINFWHNHSNGKVMMKFFSTGRTLYTTNLFLQVLQSIRRGRRRHMPICERQFL